MSNVDEQFPRAAALTRANLGRVGIASYLYKVRCVKNAREPETNGFSIHVS